MSKSKTSKFLQVHNTEYYSLVEPASFLRKALPTFYETVKQGACVKRYYRPSHKKYRDTLKTDTGMLTKYNQALRKRGIFKGRQKYYIGPCHTDEDVEQTIRAFQEVAAELKG